MEIRRIGDTTDQLGESCVWSEAEQALYWIDVRGECVRRYDWRSGETATHALGEMAGSIALRARGGLVVALRRRIVAFDPANGLQTLAEPHETIPNQRFNDGRCDRQGRFWVGSMDDLGRGPVGTLYRLDADGALHPTRHGVTIPNSLAFAPRSDRMYFSDTSSRTITLFDFDAEAGLPSAGREFARTPAPSTPDGSTVDAEGFLWNAQYDGWRVVRYAPDGQVDRVIEMPVQRPTCCAFGGPDLGTLFVTTAAQHLSPDERAAQPLAGGLLALDVGVTGLAEPAYRG